jgi:hypothetical protein
MKMQTTSSQMTNLQEFGSEALNEKEAAINSINNQYTFNNQITLSEDLPYFKLKQFVKCIRLLN